MHSALAWRSVGTSTAKARVARIAASGVPGIPRKRTYSTGSPDPTVAAASLAEERSHLVTMQCPVPIPADAQRVLDAMRSAAEARCPGLELRVAGGWVRDLLRLSPEFRFEDNGMRSRLDYEYFEHYFASSLSPAGSVSAAGVDDNVNDDGPLYPPLSTHATHAQLMAAAALDADIVGTGNGIPLLPPHRSLLRAPPHLAPPPPPGAATGLLSAAACGLGDIDIALSTLTGQEFLPHLSAHAAAHGLSLRMSSVESDAATSRHLATCRGSFAGFDVDLVNLRSESYANDAAHRVPTAVGLGTPRQDALRRDFTANALFLNLHTGLIEDWHGGRALADLQCGLLRTPLPPLQIFADDPLRVLRVVRFAARLAFLPVPELFPAAAAAPVRRALARKVSRERVGIEVTKALEAPARNLGYTARLLRALGVADTVAPRAAPRLMAAELVLKPTQRLPRNLVKAGSAASAAAAAAAAESDKADAVADTDAPATAAAAAPDADSILAAAGPAAVAAALSGATLRQVQGLAVHASVTSPPPGAGLGWRRREWRRVEARLAALEVAAELLAAPEQSQAAEGISRAVAPLLGGLGPKGQVCMAQAVLLEAPTRDLEALMYPPAHALTPVSAQGADAPAPAALPTVGAAAFPLPLPWWRQAPVQGSLATHVVHCLFPPFLAPPPLGMGPVDAAAARATLAAAWASASAATAAAAAAVGGSAAPAGAGATPWTLFTGPAAGLRVPAAAARFLSGIRAATAPGATAGAAAACGSTGPFSSSSSSSSGSSSSTSASSSCSTSSISGSGAGPSHAPALVSALRAASLLLLTGAQRRPLIEADAAAAALEASHWLTRSVAAWAAEAATTPHESATGVTTADGAAGGRRETFWGRAFEQARALRHAGGLAAWRRAIARENDPACAGVDRPAAEQFSASVEAAAGQFGADVRGLLSRVAACERAGATTAAAASVAHTAAVTALHTSRKKHKEQREALDAAAQAARADADTAAATEAAVVSAALAGTWVESVLPVELMAAAAVLRAVGGELLPAAVALAATASIDSDGDICGGSGKDGSGEGGPWAAAPAATRGSLEGRVAALSAWAREADAVGLLSLSQSRRPGAAVAEDSGPGAAGADVIAALLEGARSAGWELARESDLACNVQGVSDAIVVITAVVPGLSARDALKQVRQCLG